MIIGENGTGKTFLLKALYSAVKSLEDYKRGDDISPINDILSEKLTINSFNKSAFIRLLFHPNNKTFKTCNPDIISL